MRGAKELVSASPSVTRDGATVIVGSQKSTAFLLDPVTGAVLRSFDPLAPPGGGGLSFSATSNDGNEQADGPLAECLKMAEEEGGGGMGVDGVGFLEGSRSSEREVAGVSQQHQQQQKKEECDRLLASSLLVLRTDYVVRAVELRSGKQRWNVSFGELSPVNGALLGLAGGVGGGVGGGAPIGGVLGGALGAGRGGGRGKSGMDLTGRGVFDGHGNEVPKRQLLPSSVPGEDTDPEIDLGIEAGGQGQGGRDDIGGSGLAGFNTGLTAAATTSIDPSEEGNSDIYSIQLTNSHNGQQAWQTTFSSAPLAAFTPSGRLVQEFVSRDSSKDTGPGQVLYVGRVAGSPFALVTPSTTDAPNAALPLLPASPHSPSPSDGLPVGMSAGMSGGGGMGGGGAVAGRTGKFTVTEPPRIAGTRGAGGAAGEAGDGTGGGGRGRGRNRGRLGTGGAGGGGSGGGGSGDDSLYPIVVRAPGATAALYDAMGCADSPAVHGGADSPGAEYGAQGPWNDYQGQQQQGYSKHQQQQRQQQQQQQQQQHYSMQQQRAPSPVAAGSERSSSADGEDPLGWTGMISLWGRGTGAGDTIGVASNADMEFGGGRGEKNRRLGPPKDMEPAVGPQAPPTPPNLMTSFGILAAAAATLAGIVAGASVFSYSSSAPSSSSAAAAAASGRGTPVRNQRLKSQHRQASSSHPPRHASHMNGASSGRVAYRGGATNEDGLSWVARGLVALLPASWQEWAAERLGGDGSGNGSSSRKRGKQGAGRRNKSSEGAAGSEAAAGGAEGVLLGKQQDDLANGIAPPGQDDPGESGKEDSGQGESGGGRLSRLLGSVGKLGSGSRQNSAGKVISRRGSRDNEGPGEGAGGGGADNGAAGEGESEEEREEREEGRWVGRLFVSRRVIGHGSHGTLVLEGRLEGRQVAVKRLLSQFYERARQEIAALIATDEHPNVVRCFAMEEDESFVYVALERCAFNLTDLVLACRASLAAAMAPPAPAAAAAAGGAAAAAAASGAASAADGAAGGAAAEIIAAALERVQAYCTSQGVGVQGLCLWDDKGQPTQQLVGLLRDVASGLAYLHDQRIVHRDLKPHNVLISLLLPSRHRQRGQSQARASAGVVNGDMGISKRLGDGASSFDTMTAGSGSSGWQAPEQLEDGSRLTKSVDMFSFGCLVFFCVSGGSHPFGEWFERDANVLAGRADLFPIDHVPEALDLVAALLDRDPEKRADLFPIDHVPEALDLVAALLDRDPEKRPPAHEVQRHPFFWPAEQRLAFLRDASDRVEGEDRELHSPLLNALEARHPFFWPAEQRLAFLRDASDRVEGEDRELHSPLLNALEAVAPRAIARKGGISKAPGEKGGGWNERVDGALLGNLGKYRRYNFHSVRDLLRVIRNKCNHYRELPPELQLVLFEIAMAAALASPLASRIVAISRSPRLSSGATAFNGVRQLILRNYNSPERDHASTSLPVVRRASRSRVVMASASAADGGSTAAAGSDELAEFVSRDNRRMLHVVYRVGNLDAAIKFYTECLGMKLLRQRDIPEEKYSNAFLGYGPETSTFVVELTYNYGVDSYDIGAGFGHFGISVDDVYKTVEVVKSRGGKVTREAGPVKGGQSVIAFVEDPSGYKWEIIQRPPTPEPLCQVMLRVGDLDRAIKFYEKAYGMKLLRTRDNPQYKYTIAMVGYGPEAESAVVELTYNYGVESYEKGNAYAQIAIGTDDVYKTAEAIRAAGGTITREPGPIPGINTKIVACLDPDGYKTVFVDNQDFLPGMDRAFATYCLVGGCWGVPLSFILGPLAYWFTCVPCYAESIRRQLRHKKGLHERPMDDFAAHCCCHPCALCQVLPSRMQEYRETREFDLELVAGPTHLFAYVTVPLHPPTNMIMQEYRETREFDLELVAGPTHPTVDRPPSETARHLEHLQETQQMER
ncbi:unnamed protein product [Closterium sp. NIES-64]|nr:unnamed protein product [Closterium sp. NIES-64]